MTMQYSLARIVAGLDAVGPGFSSYLNRLTGEVITCSDDEIDAVEADTDDIERPDWELEQIEQARAVLASDDWLPLPDSFEIHEYQIMEDFAESQSGRVQEELLRALRGAGAFRRFKDELERLQIRDEWFRHRRQALVEIAREWLEANDLPFDPMESPDADGTPEGK